MRISSDRAADSETATIPSRDKRLLPDLADPVAQLGEHRAAVRRRRRGGGGGRGRGPRGAPQGVAALWGAQRVMRQRINRVHFSFYDTFGDSAFNARPYSLYEANPPKISSWTESAGINIGGPLKIPHVYDGTDKTFFYINFGGTWSRSPVDQFATVPTLAERNGDFSADNVQLYDPLSNLTGPRTFDDECGLLPGHSVVTAASGRHLHSHKLDQPAGDQSARPTFPCPIFR